MIDLTSIVKSSTFITLCIGIILISGIIVTIYLVIKNKEKRKQKHNTKELNDTLSMEILNEKNNPVVVLPDKESVKAETIEEKPVVVIDSEEKKIDVVEELSKEVVKNKEEIELLENIESKEQPEQIVENQNEATIIEDVIENKTEEQIVEEIKEEPIQEEKGSKYEINEEEKLVYAPIELDEEEAKEELERLTMELSLKETEEEKEEINEEEKNITLTNFEKEQEENAIISLDELMERGREIYNNNEMVGYDDEGDEPITIEQLQEKWEKEKQTISQIELEEKIEEIEAVKEETKENVSVNMTENVQNTVIVPERAEIKEATKEKEVVKKVEFPSILPSKKDVYETKFTNSPIISPVYGIERKKFEEEEKLHPEIINKNDLELENTANYEKFDEEIKKTNEFIAALKELQKKLD